MAELPPLSDVERRQELARLVLTHYMTFPVEIPPEVIEAVLVARIAETPGLRDLDRIVREGAEILSHGIQAAHQAMGS